MNTKPGLPLLFFIIILMVSNSIPGQKLGVLLKSADSLRQLDNFTALPFYHRALERSIAQKKDDTTGLIYLRIGIVFDRKSLYSKALQNYFEALKIFERTGARKNAAIVKKNIGNVYRSTKKFERAFYYVNTSYGESKNLGDTSNMFSALNDLGLICMDQNRTNEALTYFNAALLSPDDSANHTVRVAAITNLASIYWLKEDYYRAVNYYQQAYRFTKQAGDKFKMALVLLNTGGLYNDMKLYAKALDAQKQGIELAGKIKAKDLLQYGYENYANIYSRMGNYRKAHEAAVTSLAWKDSIISEISDQYRLSEVVYQNEEEISRREQEETKNRLLKKANNLQTSEIQNKEKQLEQRNWLLFAVMVIGVLVILALFLFYKAYRARQQNEIIVEKQRSVLLENQLKESELTALRAQMNPHFIFNALSSIKNYMLEQNVQLADYYLGKFAKLIRLILDNSSQNFVSLEKELQLLESYIQLEQLRFENKFSYEIKIDEEINSMETFIPSMIVQPFVENAIIHGFMHKEGKCRLSINIRYNTGYLTVEIKDDGIGRVQSAKLKSNSGNTLHQSKGFEISERRLKVLSKSNNIDSGIVYKDLCDDNGATGTLVNIVIPIEQNNIL